MDRVNGMASKNQHQGPSDAHDATTTTTTSAKTSASDTAVTFKRVADKVLVFLSNASNETIGACLAGLGATTYFVFGRVGLVLIGIVGGVVLHAHWESGGGGQDADARLKESTRRREVGMDVMSRVLDWQAKRKHLQATANEDEVVLKSSDYSDFPPETSSALNVLTDAIVKDYVKWWYNPILPAEIVFPSACRQTLSSFILALSNNVARKRPADTFLEFTTNSSSIIIVFLTELSHALSASPSSKPHDALKTYLRLKPESSLANIMDQKHQIRKLRMIADDILEKYLDPNVYRCSPARIFLREMLANVVLDMTIQRCSKAEWINDWIVYLLEEGEPEIMNAIDAGVESAGGKQALELKKEVVAKAEATPESSDPEDQVRKNHRRTVSRAEEAMDEAMKEAQRLTQLIIEEDERRQREQRPSTEEISSPAIQNKEDPTPEAAKTAEQLPTQPLTNSTAGLLTPTQATTITEEPESEAAESNEPPIADASPSVASQPAASLPANESFSEESTFTNGTTVRASEEAIFRPRIPEPFTLHRATVTIFDDGLSGEKRPPKTKPTAEYMIQIEPANSAFSGWMIPRTYGDFETLHEILRRIANIAGVPFARIHPELPQWRNLNKLRLRDELDRYLADALQYEQLAESEGMKRFLEKERGFAASPRAGFWQNPAQVGKGMFDALARAPNQVAGGGKALFGGVANALSGSNGQKAAAGGSAPPTAASPVIAAPNPKRASMSATPEPRPVSSTNPVNGRMSFDVLRKPGAGTVNPPPIQRLSSDTRRSSSSTLSSMAQLPNTNGGAPHLPSAVNEQLEALAAADQPRRRSETPEMSLPPPPDMMPDDYTSPEKIRPKLRVPDHTSQMSVDGTSFFDVPTPSSQASRDVSPRPPSSRVESPRGRMTPKEFTSLRPPAPAPTAKRDQRSKQPLTEQEAQVTVELLFAVINELYTLSSAWNIRRTLLTAAKSFLLRPGNPQLDSIRALLQESVLDANTADAGVAAHLLKLRENTMPTDDELKRWPPPPSAEEKEALRVKARKLLVQRGMPQALTSVMGAAASGEALGRVFDCLQVEEVARGIMFGLLLQGVRAVTQ